MLKMNTLVKIFLLLSLIETTSILRGQEKDYPWQTIVNKDGLKISFIFYQKSVQEKNGVVLKLENHSDDSLHYSFEIVFKNTDTEYSEQVEGMIKPHEIKTGSDNKLYWVPFKSDKSISEVGIRKLRIIATN
jgi:hypothetical protein